MIVRRVFLFAALLGLSACAGSRAPTGHPASALHDDAAARDVMQLRYRVDLGQSVKSPDPQQRASAVIDPQRDRFYSAASKGNLCARKLSDASVIWCTPLGGEHRGKPLLTPEGDLLIAQDNGELRWYDAEVLLAGKELKPRWRFRSPGLIHEPPVVANGFVYLPSSRNEVIALDERTGQWRWTYERELPKDFSILGRAGILYQKDSSQADGGVLYTGFDDGQVVAIDAVSGQARWAISLAPPESKNLADVDTTPILFKKSQTLVVAGAALGIVGLNPKDGSRRWTLPVKDFNQLTQVDEERFLAASPTQGLWLLDRRGKVIWRKSLDRGTVTAPAVYQDLVFVGHDTQGLMVFDLSTGEMLVAVDLRSGTQSQPVIAPQRGIMLYITHHAWLLGFDLWDSARSLGSKEQRAGAM